MTNRPSGISRAVLAALAMLLLAGCAPAQRAAAQGPSASSAAPVAVETVALWTFDAQPSLYPSSSIDDVSANDATLILGRGGRIVEGRFGTALAIAAPEPLEVTGDDPRFGLAEMAPAAGRSTPPLTWHTAGFAALMTMGEAHLRRQVATVNPTATALNLGNADWTVEFWYRADHASNEAGTVLDIGTGPRGENDIVTRLSLNPDRRAFRLVNQPSGTDATVVSEVGMLDSDQWHHYAFVYDATAGRLRHYVDGHPVGEPVPVRMAALPEGEEAYLSVGRDGVWEHPLAGALDELRISRGQVYDGAFAVPGSFVGERRPDALAAGPPLLFGADADPSAVVELGSRKHLFIDDALVAEQEHVTFVVNPPRLAERVIAEVEGPFRKHLNVVEGGDGVIRIYYGAEDDNLAVRTSRDGVHFEIPDLGTSADGGSPNIAVPEPTAVGTVFLDPNAPPTERWKFISDFHRQGIYVYTSPDGYHFTRHEPAAMPFRAGSQSTVFYDDQRQRYIGYHRSDFGMLPDGGTKRTFVFTEVKDLMQPWPFEPVSQASTRAAAGTLLLREPQPWYLDNGPLTPGGFGIEYPTVFGPEPIDPPSTDIYVPKVVKYERAPDTYLAFPVIYFHYEASEPTTRRLLGDSALGLGSGPVETQLSVSRDGVHWQRYPRPAYIGIGRHDGQEVHQAYIAQGLVHRGDEIWQYYFGTDEYHSSMSEAPPKRSVFRTVQRLDGFVSADTPYDTLGTLTTRPLRFTGSRLTLNVDTDAAGYLQVGILDEAGNAISGFGLDACVYVNGDFTAKEVAWLAPDGSMAADVSSLAGRVVRLVFRSRGAKLYAFQFTDGEG